MTCKISTVPSTSSHSDSSRYCGSDSSHREEGLQDRIRTHTSDHNKDSQIGNKEDSNSMKENVASVKCREVKRDSSVPLDIRTDVRDKSGEIRITMLCYL